MPSFSAHFFASARSREAIAWMRQCLLFCIAGMTFAVPIRAVLMMPQFTGCMALSPVVLFARGRRLSRRVQTPQGEGPQHDRTGLMRGGERDRNHEQQRADAERGLQQRHGGERV